MRERLRNFERVYEFFLFTQKRIERFNESRFKSRKVKGRATSSENRKFFVAVMEGTLGVVKKMLTNSGFVKLLWAYVVFARAGKTKRLLYFRKRLFYFGKDYSTFFLYKLVRFQFYFILTISPEECQMKSFGKKNLLLQAIFAIFNSVAHVFCGNAIY